MSKTAAILLTFFLGGFGYTQIYDRQNRYRCYLANYRGVFVCWLLVDFIKVCMGTFQDKNGNNWVVEDTNYNTTAN